MKTFSTMVIIALIIFPGNAVMTCKCTDSIKIFTVRGTAFEAAKTSGGGTASENGKSIMYIQCNGTGVHVGDFPCEKHCVQMISTLNSTKWQSRWVWD